MPLTAVVLNDTSIENHHGCRRVMRLLSGHLRSRGIRLLARSPVRHKWHNDPVFLDALSAADFVIINGEGTLHHGRRAAERLLKIVDHPARGTKPVVLLNALYQDNPANWARYLEKMALIAVRDRQSGEEIKYQAGRDCLVVPDLSLSAGAIDPKANSVRTGVIFGDSVLKPVSEKLRSLAIQSQTDLLMPTSTAPFTARPRWPEPLQTMHRSWSAAARTIFNNVHTRRKYLATEAEYAAHLAGCELHVTGRFHAVCFSLMTRTPFLAIASNSHKIESLLLEAGLNADRLIEISQLEECMGNSNHRHFTPEEVSNLKLFLSDSCRRAAALFDKVRDVGGPASHR